MRVVGIKILKNKLSEYIRIAAAGERVLVTDRDRVVAELVPPQSGGSTADAALAEAVRSGWVRPPVLPALGPRDDVRRRDAFPAARSRRARRVIYVDTSVALAHLLAEDKRPGADFWSQPLIASRLLDYEINTRLSNLRVPAAGKEIAAALIQRVAIIELVAEVVDRARANYPVQVRTLDALHLASVEFLRDQGVDVQLATYDQRLRECAMKLKIPLYEL